MIRELASQHSDWANAQATILIGRQVDVVFSFVTNSQNDVVWMPKFGTVRQLTLGPIGVGTRFRQTALFLGSEVEADWEIVEFATNQWMKGESVAGPFEFKGGYLCQGEGSATRVTKFASVYLPRMLPFVPKAVVSSLLSGEFESALKRAKIILEG